MANNIIDSIQLSGVTYDIQGEITIDAAFDSGSTNPVENRVITPAATKHFEGEYPTEYTGGYSGGTYVGGFSAETYEEAASYVIRNTAYITRLYKDGIRMKFIDAEGVETEFACSASTYYNTVYNPPSSYATITIDTVGKNIEITPLDNYKLSYVVFYGYYDNSLMNSTNNAFSALTYQEYDKTAIQLIDELSVQKQDTLSAGTGISIVDNVISATGGGGSSYTAGDGIDITNDVISVTGKVDTSTYNTYTAATDTALASKADTATTYTKTETDNAITAATSTKQDTLVSGTNIKTINNESILGSGNIDIQGSGNPTVELTQAEYDALVSAGTVSADTYYIITDAQAGDLTNYYTKTETNTLLGGKADTATTYTKTEVDNAITAATSTKQDTLVSGTNIKTINNESLLGSGNIDIQGGGGTTYTAGRGISIANDTISFSLPISAGTETGSLIIGDNGGGTSYASVASGEGAVVFPSRIYYGKNYAIGGSSFAHGSGCSAGTCCHAEGFNTKCVIGFNSHSEGDSTEANGYNSHSEGDHTLAGQNSYKYSCHAEGYYTSAMTSYSHAEGYYTKTTNESEHASGRYNNSVSATTTFGDSGNTLFSVGNGTSTSARHNAFEIRQNGDMYLNNGTSDIKLQDYLQIKVVKLTQSAYDALSPNYDANTLYVIVN